MADRHLAPSLSVRLSPEDHEWLAKRAKHEGTSPHTLVKRAVRFFRFWQSNENIVEAALTAAYVLREYQKQVGRQRYFQSEYQMQSRRLHNQRRAYQRRLWNEQNLRRAYQRRLWDEQNLRRACERRLQRQHGCDERQARAATEADRDAPYSPTVARLLALAVCSESDDEAKAAFTKARTLYRIRVLSHALALAGMRATRPPESTSRTCLVGIPVEPRADARSRVHRSCPPHGAPRRFMRCRRSPAWISGCPPVRTSDCPRGDASVSANTPRSL